MVRNQSWRAVWIVVLVAFAGTLAGSAQPLLVADLHQERVPADLQPHLSRGVEHDGVYYFSGHDPQHGAELWRTDGTPEGTYALVDLCPGSCDGLGEPLGFFAGHLYFRGDDREHGIEIWRTDGTVGGEELLADLCPGTCGTQPSNWLAWRGALWFVIGQTLWTSDGTAENTELAADLCDDLKICGVSPDSIFLPGPNATDEGLFLSLYSTGNPHGALYRTDGTVAGTVLLRRFAKTILTAAEASGRFYFVDGSALWTSDGTPAGTRFVRNLSELVHGYVFDIASRVVDGIFYVLFDLGDWLRSDGTAAGTIELARLDFSHSGQFLIAQIGGVVFAVTEDGIWRTEGTPETTVRIDAPRTQFGLVVERPNRLFVFAYDSNDFIWSTDGSANGFRRLRLDGPPPPDTEMAGLGEGVLISRGYRELWRVDGAGTSAEPVHDFQPANDGSGPSAQVVLENRLLFFSLVGRELSQLFSSDGTAAGTAAIGPPGYETAFDTESPFFRPQSHLLTRAGGEAFFNGFRASRFWATDGTREGTRTVKPGASFYVSFGMTAPIGLVGGGFVFGANLGLDVHACDSGDLEPWIRDGRGTRQLVNLNPFEFESSQPQCDKLDASSAPGPGVVVGRIALFPADDLVHGRELFATDGTKEGTRLVADLNRNLEPNPEFYPHHPEYGPELAGVGSDPSDLARAGSNVFFVADDGRTGRELWVTNGTRRGTRRVADLVRGRASSSPHDLVAVGDALYFFAPHGSGDGLYKSDGTRQGTVLVSDLSGGSQARELSLVRGKLFFAAFLRETGTELWTSEGTAATTRGVADLRPGPRGSQPQNLKAVGDRVVFAAEDGTSGLEPWSSDGTAEGTLRWGDIAPGSAASSPGPFSVANGQVLFGADDGEHGRELWAIPVADVAASAHK
jgi:ELWxxDGT repeat protein